MNPTFNELLQDLMRAKGMDPAQGGIGLEFEADGLQVYAVQHPLHPDRGLVEVALHQLNELDQGRVAPLLMHLNEAARFEHDWTIVMDSEGVVLLSTVAWLPALRAPDLEALMAEGIDRALALQTTLEALLQAQPQSEPSDQDPAFGLLRG